MITIKFVEVSQSWVDSMEGGYASRISREILTPIRTDSWYESSVPRQNDRLDLPAREVKRVGRGGGGSGFYTETEGPIVGFVREVVWTGDGCVDVVFELPEDEG